MLPHSDSRRLSPHPSSGAPGRQCWLCHNVPQHGRRPNQTISLLQEIHLANSAQGSRFGWSDCRLITKGKTGRNLRNVWALLILLGSPSRPCWQPTAPCGPDICLRGLSIWWSTFPSADIGSTRKKQSSHCWRDCGKRFLSATNLVKSRCLPDVLSDND